MNEITLKRMSILSGKLNMLNDSLESLDTDVRHLVETGRNRDAISMMIGLCDKEMLNFITYAVFNTLTNTVEETLDKFQDNEISQFIFNHTTEYKIYSGIIPDKLETVPLLKQVNL